MCRISTHHSTVWRWDETTVNGEKTAAHENLQRHRVALKHYQAAEHFSTSVCSFLPESAPPCCQTLTPKHSSCQAVWWGTHRAFQRPEGGHLLEASLAETPALSAADWRSGGKLPECVSWPLWLWSVHQYRTVLKTKRYKHEIQLQLIWVICILGIVGNQ